MYAIHSFKKGLKTGIYYLRTKPKDYRPKIHSRTREKHHKKMPYLVIVVLDKLC